MIEVTTNTQQLDDALNQLQRRLSNIRQPMADIGQALETSIRTRRETQTDPNGNRWAEWSPSYRADYNRRRAGEGPPRGKLLERTGDMWEGLTWSATGNSVRVGFSQLYATFHELGAPARNMPRRGLLFADPDSGTLGAQEEDAVLEVLEKWLSDVFD